MKGTILCGAFNSLNAVIQEVFFKPCCCTAFCEYQVNWETFLFYAVYLQKQTRKYELLENKGKPCYEELIRELLHFVKLKIEGCKYLGSVWKPGGPSSFQELLVAEEPEMVVPSHFQQKTFIYYFIVTFFPHQIPPMQGILKYANACIVLIAQESLHFNAVH